MSTVKPEPQMSENQTTAATQSFYPHVDDILAALNIPADNSSVTQHQVLSSAKMKLVRADINFQMPTEDPQAKQYLIDIVDEISAQFPAAKPALQMNADGLPNNHILSFLTLLN